MGRHISSWSAQLFKCISFGCAQVHIINFCDLLFEMITVTKKYMILVCFHINIKNFTPKIKLVFSGMKTTTETLISCFLNIDETFF